VKKNLFDKVAVLGLGLIGGSIALDLKSRRLCKTLNGYNRSRGGRIAAQRKKACDQTFARPEAAVRGADLVILATPVQHIPRLAKQVAPFLKAGAVVTDVGSTKAGIVKKISRALPRGVAFVGGHPIAGTDKSGMTAAQKNLFAGRWWLFTPGPRNQESLRALKKLQSLAEALGAKTAVLSPGEHDRILAAISHLPHLTAYSLVDAVLSFRKGRAIRYAAGGFRDFTRIAASSPEMWTDICLENRAALLAMLSRFEKSLRTLRRHIAKKNAAGLRRLFSRAAEARRRL
jgi:cyclohexadieny/prephenate dehydrogenase